MTSTTSTPPAAPPLPSDPITTAIASSSPPTTDTNPNPNPSLTPLQAASLRLTTLEHLLSGPSSSSATTSSSSPALLRLTSTLTSLSTLASTSKPLHRLLADWPLYSDLLSPLPSTSKPSVWDPIQQSTYLLTLDSELRESLTHLEIIHRLQKVLSARDLTRVVDETKPKLSRTKHTEEHAKHTTETLNQHLLLLVTRWSQYTTSLSQAFTSLDSQLWTLERQLTAIERQL